MISGTVSPAITWRITSTLYGSHVIMKTAKTDVKIRPARPCPDLSILAPFEFPNWQRDILREWVTTLVSFKLLFENHFSIKLSKTSLLSSSKLSEVLIQILTHFYLALDFCKLQPPDYKCLYLKGMKSILYLITVY